MIENTWRIYDGSAANACRSADGFTVYITRGGAVYRGEVNGFGTLSPLRLWMYCDEVIPFGGGQAERRGTDVRIKS